MKKSLVIFVIIILGIFGFVYANGDDQEASDAESAAQQAESDAESAAQQAESDSESEEQQEESDKESLAQQAASDASSASQQKKSDKESEEQQEESDKESARQQVESDEESAREQAASDFESFLEQASSDFRSKFKENQERKVNLEVVSELDEKGEAKQKIKFRGVGVESDFEVEGIEEGEAKIRLSDGNYQDINVMPITAFKIALEKLRTSNINIELEEFQGEELAAVYVASADKTIKILGLFETKHNLEVEINVEDGEIKVEEKPWWWFMVEEVDELEEDELELQLIKPIQDIILIKNQEKKIDLNEYFLNAESYSVFNSENVFAEISENILTIKPSVNWTGVSSFSVTAFKGEESLDGLFNVIVSEGNLSIQTLQYGAILNEPVKWEKKVKVDEKKRVTLRLPKNSENIVVKTNTGVGEILLQKETQDDLEIEIEEDENYEVEYYTQAPYSIEKEISLGKEEITIVGSEEVHYTNILAYKQLTKEVPADLVKLFWITESGRNEIEVDKYDLNSNGLVDYIEWIVPMLSNQTYELELVDFASGNFTIVSPENNSVHNLNWIYVNVTSLENLNSALLNWENSSGITNVTMSNDSSTHWFKNMTSLSDGDYSFLVFAENLSNFWIESNRVFFKIDSTNPVISIVYPINTSYALDVTTLNYTFSEDNFDKCWYSIDGGVTNSSRVSCGENFTGLISSQGSNTWNIYINDTAGNEAQDLVTFFKDTVYPLIDYGVLTAGDNDVVSQNWIYVNVSATELNEDTITFSLYNSTGEVNSIFYTDSTRIVNWTGLADGVYTYNVTINDTLGNTNVTSMRTLTLDTSAPVITFSCDKVLVYHEGTITCSCSATSATDLNPEVTYTQNPFTDTPGTFTTTCTALDDAGVSSVSSISYTVEFVQSGGGQITSWKMTYVVNDEQLKRGYAREMKVEERMKIKINNKEHSVGLIELTDKTAKISVNSILQEAILEIGEEEKFEVSGDDYYDILIKLNSIENSLANLTVQLINEKIPKEVIEEKEEPSFEEKEKEEEKTNWKWFVIIIAVLVLIGIGYRRFRNDGFVDESG